MEHLAIPLCIQFVAGACLQIDFSVCGSLLFLGMWLMMIDDRSTTLSWWIRIIERLRRPRQRVI